MDTDRRLKRIMVDRDRNGKGRFTAEYHDEAFLATVTEHEPATTTEVADAIGCVRQNADYRLRRLRDAGKVASKKAGPSVVWMLSGNESAA